MVLHRRFRGSWLSGWILFFCIIFIITGLASGQTVDNRASDFIPPDTAPPAQDTRTAPAPAPAIPALPVTVQIVQPNMLLRGNTYQLTLKGNNIKETTQFDLGPGITIKGKPKIINISTAHIQVSVDNNAPPGLRHVKVVAGGLGQFSVQTATVTVQEAKKYSAPVKQQVTKANIPTLDLQGIIATKGSITLVEPHWRTHIGNTMPLKGPDGKPLGTPEPIYKEEIPTIHDEVLFTWKEQNPGLAERYEVRFYISGKLVKTVSIEPILFLGKYPMLPTWYRPKGPVLAAILAELPETKGKSGNVKINTGSLAKSDLEKAIAKADISWEVAGFRIYNKSGLSMAAQPPSQQVLFAASKNANQTATDAPVLKLPELPQKQEVEVEISERWPLIAPDKPTGFNCAAAKGGLNLVNIDRKTVQKEDKKVEYQSANHTDERFELKGVLDFSKSPYATHAATSKSNVTTGWDVSSSGFSMDVKEKTSVLSTAWQFENVFIDWGDGTVEPLHLTQWGDQEIYKSGMPIQLEKAMEKYQHAYQEIGDYTVRVYQLSADDAQTGSQQVVSFTTGQGSSLYEKAVALGGAQSNAVPEQSLNIAKAIADRAYMLFCENVKIQPRHDPYSDGPLNLVSIEVQGFPGPASESQMTMANIVKDKAVSGAVINIPSASPGKSAAQQGIASKSAKDKAVLDAKAISAVPLFAIDSEGLPVFTACDDSITAGAKLSYYGEGKARLRWRLDGLNFHEETIHVGPSKPRSDEALAKLSQKNAGGNLKQWMALLMPLVDTMAPLKSSPVNLDQIGKHEIVVEAEVVFEQYKLYDYAAKALGAYGTGTDAAAAKLFMDSLKPGQKIGVLSPFKTSPAGLPPVSYLNAPLTQLAQKKEPVQLAALTFSNNAPPLNNVMKNISISVTKKSPPTYVVSGPEAYRVVGHDSSQPCTFLFPVKDGSFKVVGLQEPGSKSPKVTHKDNVFKGMGDLIISLPDQNGSLKQSKIPISFSNWVIGTDGVKVESGMFSVPNVSLGNMYLPGLSGTVTAISGKAGDHVNATLNAQLSNKQLTLAAEPGKVPAWTNVTAPLSPDGDWFAENLPSAGETLIYSTPFTITPKTVALDLSVLQGAGADTACSGNSGASWQGVHLGTNVALSIFDFELAGDTTTNVTNWGIDKIGLCGKTVSGSMDKPLLKGRVKWDSVNMTAQNGDFHATYNGMKVKIPWLNVELKGASAPVMKKDGVITLSLTGNAPPLTYGPVTMEAKNLLFTVEKGVGPVARSDTRFDFTGEGKPFATEIWVNDLLFGLDGKAYFEQGGGKKTLSLGGKSGNISLDTANHKSVVVSALAGTEARLRFDFTSDLKISDALPAAVAGVSYAINESQDKYSASGPAINIQPITTYFPDAQPSVSAKIKPSYAAVSSGGGSASLFPFDLVSSAYADSGTIRYHGSIDLGMFGTEALAGVTGEFILGSLGNDDYWAAKVLKDLPGGVPVVPPLVSMYQIGGGLGYNVALNVCEGSDLSYVMPKIDGQVAFFAQSLFGSPDQFAYKLRGCLTVKKSGTRMDYDAWLLNKEFGTINMLGSSGKKGDFYGYFQYAGGSFDGTMNGEYNFLENMAYVKAENDAVKLHFASNSGYIHAGSKQTPITGHVFIIDANAYLGVDLYPTPGFMVGASSHKKLVAGDCDDVCAKVEGHIVVDAGITAEPKLSYNNSAGLSAKGCIDDECFGASVSTKINGSALPPYLKFSTSFGSCPTPDVSLGLRILPSPSPSVSFDWCDVSSIF